MSETDDALKGLSKLFAAESNAPGELVDRLICSSPVGSDTGADAAGARPALRRAKTVGASLGPSSSSHTAGNASHQPISADVEAESPGEEEGPVYFDPAITVHRSADERVPGRSAAAVSSPARPGQLPSVDDLDDRNSNVETLESLVVDENAPLFERYRAMSKLSELSDDSTEVSSPNARVPETATKARFRTW
jgi:hypothetical protein